MFALFITVLGFGSAAAGSSNIPRPPGALAQPAKLRSELCIHCDRMGQSPLFDAFATAVTPRLMWFNFAHLFSVSLLPLSTAWMAVSELAAQPVAFYAAVFFVVNLTCILLIRELIDRATVRRASAKMRRSMRVRSIATLCFFGADAVIALRYPLLGSAVCCCCLIAYLKPNAPGSGTQA